MYFRHVYYAVLSIFSLHTPQKCRIQFPKDFLDPQPVMLKDGHLLRPSGPGFVEMEQGSKILLSCGRYALRHDNIVNDTNYGSVTCVQDDVFQAPFLTGYSRFSGFHCSDWPEYEAIRTNRSCYDSNTVVEVGYTVRNKFCPVYESCFNPGQAQVIYSKYEQRPYNSVFQTKGKNPRFIAEDYFPGMPVEEIYTNYAVKDAIERLVGEKGTSQFWSSKNHLSRGHLAAKTDFVFKHQQRATFHHVNCALQWSGFNGGNWNSLEVDLRQHIGERGYNAVIYTGTFGVSFLFDESGSKTDLYLYKDENNNNVVPVPLYYYKVVYEPSLQLGTAFVGINNPYLGLHKVGQYVFCEDKCQGNPQFAWLTWKPDDVTRGYSFCCNIDDFRQTVPHLPTFKTDGILT